MAEKYYRPSQKAYNKILGKIAAYRASRRPDAREGGIKDAGEFIYESSREKAVRKIGSTVTQTAREGAVRKIGSTVTQTNREKAVRKAGSTVRQTSREKAVRKTGSTVRQTGREKGIRKAATSIKESSRERATRQTNRFKGESGREKANRKFGQSGSKTPSRLVKSFRRAKNSETGRKVKTAVKNNLGFGSKFSRAKTIASGKVFMAKKNVKATAKSAPGNAKKWGSAAQKAALEKARKASAAARRKGNDLSNSRLGRRLGLNKRRVTDR